MIYLLYYKGQSKVTTILCKIAYFRGAFQTGYFPSLLYWRTWRDLGLMTN